MSQIKIYIDEDALDSDRVAALRARGVARDHGSVYTFNVSDFHRLHTQWAGAGREHAGMILAPQQRFPAGEQLRRSLRLRATTTTVSMRNQIEFPGNWVRRWAQSSQQARTMVNRIV